VFTLRSSLVRRSALSLPIAMALLLGACTSASSPSAPGSAGAPDLSDCATVTDGVITLTADDLAFNVPCLVANAGEAFTIHFENLEALPHDVAVYQDESKSNEIMRGDPITGPAATMDYEVEALDAGEYYFDCTIHPAEMNGTLYVVEA
jgi:plastocyanin